LGLGRIGEMVAGYARSFGMQVTAFDPYRKSWVDTVVRASSADDLMKASDVLSIHVDLTPKTHGLVGRDLLSYLPDRALVINTSRGDVLVEEDLVQMLNEGRLAGAAVDVLIGERSAATSPLIEYARRNENLIITPHIGGATAEAMERTETHMAKLLTEYLTGLSAS